MAVALLSDVVARLGRTPLPDEQTALIARLEDAEAAIMARISGLVLQAGSDPRFRANLITVECQEIGRAHV